MSNEFDEFTRIYEGYGWIKVPRWQHDPSKTVEENYAALQEHHVVETKFLIDEVRKLATTTDQIRKIMNAEVRKIKEMFNSRTV